MKEVNKVVGFIALVILLNMVLINLTIRDAYNHRPPGTEGETLFNTSIYLDYFIRLNLFLIIFLVLPTLALAKTIPTEHDRDIKSQEKEYAKLIAEYGKKRRKGGKNV